MGRGAQHIVVIGFHHYFKLVQNYSIFLNQYQFEYVTSGFFLKKKNLSSSFSCVMCCSSCSYSNCHLPHEIPYTKILRMCLQCAYLNFISKLIFFSIQCMHGPLFQVELNCLCSCVFPSQPKTLHHIWNAAAAQQPPGNTKTRF